MQKSEYHQGRQARFKMKGEHCSSSVSVLLSLIYCLTFLLLLICMDISENPGPITNTENYDLLIDKILQMVDKRFEQNFHHIQFQSATLSNQISEQFQQVGGSLKRIEEMVLKLRQDVLDNRTDINELQQYSYHTTERLNAFEREIERLNINSRQTNLKFIGITETAPWTGSTDIDELLETLNDASDNRTWHKEDISYTFRLGTIDTRRTQTQPRPLIVSFCRLDDKIHILQDKSLRDELRRRNVKVSADLTVRQREQIAQFKDEGKLAYFKNGRLYVADGRSRRSPTDDNYSTKKHSHHQGRRGERHTVGNHFPHQAAAVRNDQHHSTNANSGSVSHVQHEHSTVSLNPQSGQDDTSNRQKMHFTRDDEWEDWPTLNKKSGSPQDTLDCEMRDTDNDILCSGIIPSAEPLSITSSVSPRVLQDPVPTRAKDRQEINMDPGFLYIPQDSAPPNSENNLTKDIVQTGTTLPTKDLSHDRGYSEVNDCLDLNYETAAITFSSTSPSLSHDPVPSPPVSIDPIPSPPEENIDEDDIEIPCCDSIPQEQVRDSTRISGSNREQSMIADNRGYGKVNSDHVLTAPRQSVTDMEMNMAKQLNTVKTKQGKESRPHSHITYNQNKKGDSPSDITETRSATRQQTASAARSARTSRTDNTQRRSLSQSNIEDSFKKTQLTTNAKRQEKKRCQSTVSTELSTGK